MCEVEVAGSDFVEHRCEEEKVFAIDQENFHIRIARQRFFQAQRGIQTAESTPQNDDALASFDSHGHPPSLLLNGLAQPFAMV